MSVLNLLILFDTAALKMASSISFRYEIIWASFWDDSKPLRGWNWLWLPKEPVCYEKSVLWLRTAPATFFLDPLCDGMELGADPTKSAPSYSREDATPVGRELGAFRLLYCWFLSYFFRLRTDLAGAGVGGFLKYLSRPLDWTHSGSNNNFWTRSSPLSGLFYDWIICELSFSFI